MGRQKMLYLSEEVFEKLKKEENASALVDSLIYKYYEQKKLENMTQEQLSTMSKELDIKIAAQLKIDELEAEKARIKKEADEKLKEIV